MNGFGCEGGAVAEDPAGAGLGGSSGSSAMMRRCEGSGLAGGRVGFVDEGGRGGSEDDMLGKKDGLCFAVLRVTVRDKSNCAPENQVRKLRLQGRLTMI